MKSIVSFNIPTHDFTFDRALTFYFICKQTNHSMYLYRNDQTCRIRRVTELISFLLTSEEKHVLIVIEGHKAKTVMKEIVNYMYAKGMPRQLV